MKKFFISIMSLIVGISGYAVVEKTIEDRVGTLESQVASLEDRVNSEHGYISGEKPTMATTKPMTTTETENFEDPSKWSKQEILDFYNKAVVETDKKAPQGQSKMVLGNGGKITADGGLGGVLDIVSPVIDKTLKRNSSHTSNIPGYGEIKLSDLKSIKATEKNGVITVELVGKEQTDGPIVDSTAGPVGRVIGTLGDIDIALNELGAEISRGKDTVSLTYTDVTVKANINKSTGIITSGRWHYLVNILVEDADIKLVVKLGVKNLRAAVDYTVTF